MARCLHSRRVTSWGRSRCGSITRRATARCCAGRALSSGSASRSTPRRGAISAAPTICYAHRPFGERIRCPRRVRAIAVEHRPALGAAADRRVCGRPPGRPGSVRPDDFQCPGHLPSGVVALNNDVALAEATLDLVDGRALREARAGDKHERRRSVFATVCVRSGDLSAESTRAIVERYVTLDVDGFWVLPFGYQPSGRQTERVLALTLALQENSGLPAVPGAMRNLWQAALARGAAAAVAGPERAALAVDLDEAPAAARAGARRGGCPQGRSPGRRLPRCDSECLRLRRARHACPRSRVRAQPVRVRLPRC